MSDPLLVQYKILSEQRLHFGRLFWNSIAFLFALVLGSIAVFKGTYLLPQGGGLLAIGGVIALMSFVAERLRRLELRYESILEAIEQALLKQGHEGIQIAPKSGERGARFVITMALFVLGIMTLGLGALELFGLMHL